MCPTTSQSADAATAGASGMMLGASTQIRDLATSALDIRLQLLMPDQADELRQLVRDGGAGVRDCAGAAADGRRRRRQGRRGRDDGGGQPGRGAGATRAARRAGRCRSRHGRRRPAAGVDVERGIAGRRAGRHVRRRTKCCDAGRRAFRCWPGAGRPSDAPTVRRGAASDCSTSCSRSTAHADVVVVDAGSGRDALGRGASGSARRLVLVVTTPDDAAIMDAYAAIKLCCDATTRRRCRTLVNRCRRRRDGRRRARAHRRGVPAVSRLRGRTLPATCRTMPSVRMRARAVAGRFAARSSAAAMRSAGRRRCRWADCTSATARATPAASAQRA